jgi:hypothetical protein
VVEDKLNGLFKSAGLYKGIAGDDEKSVDIGPNKVVEGDIGIYIIRLNGNIFILNIGNCFY